MPSAYRDGVAIEGRAPLAAGDVLVVGEASRSREAFAPDLDEREALLAFLGKL